MIIESMTLAEKLEIAEKLIESSARDFRELANSGEFEEGEYEDKIIGEALSFQIGTMIRGLQEMAGTGDEADEW